MSEIQLIELGEQILNTKTNKEIAKLDVFVDGFENSKRTTRLIKCHEAYHLFDDMIFNYGIAALLSLVQNKKGKDILNTIHAIKLDPKNQVWANIGGQLIPQQMVDGLLTKIKNDTITDWNQVHEFYESTSNKYEKLKASHALVALEANTAVSLSKLTAKQFIVWLNKYETIQTEITDRIQKTRAKDYSNSFRKMVYLNEAEMKAVVGDIKDNGFIKETVAALKKTKDQLSKIKEQLKVK